MNWEASDFERVLEGTERPFVYLRGVTSPTPLPKGALFMAERILVAALQRDNLHWKRPHPCCGWASLYCWGEAVNTCSEITIINCDTTQCTAPSPSVPVELGEGGAWLKTEALQHRLQLGWWRARGWITPGCLCHLHKSFLEHCDGKSPALVWALTPPT